MGRPRKWTDEQERAAVTTLAKGGTQEDAWLAMKKCGATKRPGPGWFSGKRNPSSARQRTGRPLAVAPPAVPPVPIRGPDTAPAELLPLLAGQLAALQTMAQAAQTEGNIGGFSNVQRALNQTIALIDKLTPPTPPDPNEAPDMRQAAEQCRAKLHELLDKIIEEQKAKPQ